MSEFVNVTFENLEKEHVCCAIGDKKHQEGVNQKKQWLAERIQEGHVFRKLNERGKVFIEYAPLEKAWCPVIGKDYLYIYCLWVAGSYKGKGYGKELIEYAISDAKQKGKVGLCTISSKKKKPFLSEKKFFEKYGFKIVDTIGDYELLVLNLEDSKEVPKFSPTAKNQTIPREEFTIFYTNQCPFTEHSIREIKETAKQINIPVSFVKVDTLEKTKSMPCIFQNWANFKDGKFLSNTILNGYSFKKIIGE